jgi:hypothetical protein
MRNVSVGAAIVGLMIGACGGSPGSTLSGSHGGGSGGSGSSGGSGGSGGGESSGGGFGDDGGPSSDDGGSSGGGSVLDGADWECQESVVLGGYSSSCVSCIQMMCSSQLDACQNSSCTTCESPVFTCESQNCSSACGGSTGSTSGGTGGDGGSASSGSCAGLMTCCSLIASVDPADATSCMTIAANNDQSSCQAVLSMLGTLASACQ